MKQRILVIDDNPINLKLALCVLELEGYLVDQAVDAEQALVFLRDTVPDLIFMDISLPGMDGLTLTRKLKAEDRFKHVPIVALTAYAMKGDRERALDAGCDGYIAKPIDTRAFPAQAAAYLQRAVTG
ncbi:response regulator [Rhodanobacter terrae]|uniref:Response regulator n=1 Tax=Rhodanobacter terrae TaxID=418647 RepID=A0ABW0SY00_9GAMM